MCLPGARIEKNAVFSPGMVSMSRVVSGQERPGVIAGRDFFEARNAIAVPKQHAHLVPNAGPIGLDAPHPDEPGWIEEWTLTGG
jgi:hypothetical protein